MTAQNKLPLAIYFPGGPVVKTWPSNAGGAGPTPSWGAKISYALYPKKQNIRQRQYCNKFNKDFKISPHQKKKKKIVSSPARPRVKGLRYRALPGWKNVDAERPRSRSGGGSYGAGHPHLEVTLFMQRSTEAETEEAAICPLSSPATSFCLLLWLQVGLFLYKNVWQETMSQKF